MRVQAEEKENMGRKWSLRRFCKYLLVNRWIPKFSINISHDGNIILLFDIVDDGRVSVFFLGRVDKTKCLLDGPSGDFRFEIEIYQIYPNIYWICLACAKNFSNIDKQKTMDLIWWAEICRDMHAKHAIGILIYAVECEIGSIYIHISRRICRTIFMNENKHA